LHGQIKEGRLFVAWSLHADQINPPPASFKMTFAEISVGVDRLAPYFPKVARPSQPWAGGHNPVGID